VEKQGQISEAEHEGFPEKSVEQKNKMSQTQLSVESDLMTRQIQL
jgi:hypothetical protein